MRGFRHGLAIALAMLVLCTCANAQFQIDKSGSVSVHIHTAEGAGVPGAQLELHMVGTAEVLGSNLVYELCAGLSQSGIDLSKPGDAALAEKLNTYIVQNGLLPQNQAVTDEQGRALFAELEAGMYLVRQNGFATKQGGAYSEIVCFVVCVPMTEENGEGWVYDIQAQPKVNALPTPMPTPSPTLTPTEKPSEEPSLPQTGMLRWPIPVLCAGGLMLFAMGWVLVFAGKKDRDA